MHLPVVVELVVFGKSCRKEGGRDVKDVVQRYTRPQTGKVSLNEGTDRELISEVDDRLRFRCADSSVLKVVEEKNYLTEGVGEDKQ